MPDIFLPVFGDFFGVAKTLLSGIWTMLNNVSVPGLPHITAGKLMVALFFASMSIRLIAYVYSFNGHGGGNGPVAWLIRSGSTDNPKISKERKGDTH